MGILIFWDEDVPEGLQQPFVRMVSHTLDMPASAQPNGMMLRGFDRSRNQNDASRILGDMQDIYTRRAGCEEAVLLVTGKDLYIRGRDFVFGLARPGVKVSVVSTARLDNRWYGRQQSDEDLMDRLVKEGCHELCHCMGLDHCENPECIMYYPQTLDELDRKKKTLCPECRQYLNLYRFSD
ncbi:peptidase zinc-dependent [Methanolacinia petrolearia DSM 11571]|uniref:Peptidase zinc-dependent n=1 Tax=Methanolacinia petrolearia (strain DSM 11571 / OCM 486 / SEBR 4847) TaxID=679926 RepID=E1RKR5_METP4|nr:archaemetzincin family Zn-dependent metalloprotease [Methanolacinia petrolearia]ADN37004.1 peptidase zinc-dependent [Methanolacinia petrolearia DSM 11571]